MTINEYWDEVDGLTEDRKTIARENFLKYLLNNPIQCEDFITAMMVEAAEAEDDDYFGTEGMQV